MTDGEGYGVLSMLWTMKHIQVVLAKKRKNEARLDEIANQHLGAVGHRPGPGPGSARETGSGEERWILALGSVFEQW